MRRISDKKFTPVPIAERAVLESDILLAMCRSCMVGHWRGVPHDCEAYRARHANDAVPPPAQKQAYVYYCASCGIREFWEAWNIRIGSRRRYCLDCRFARRREYYKNYWLKHKHQ